jgi:hypothetical protein
MFDLLCRRKMPPAGREIGNARHIWETDDPTVVETDTLLARSLERGACLGHPPFSRILRQYKRTAP